MCCNSNDPRHENEQASAMLLINCTACGKQVSTKAKACPNCGHPVAETPTSLPATSIMIGGPLLVIGGILCSVFFGFFYDTSVSTDFGRVHNTGLMQNRELGLIVGIGLVIAGVVLAISKRTLPGRRPSPRIFTKKQKMIAFSSSPQSQQD
jgi:hypothetical protein